MEVLFLEINNDKACLYRGVWARGTDVDIISSVPDSDYKLQRPTNINSVFKEMWTLSISSPTKDTLVVVNKSIKDAVLVYNSKEFSVPWKSVCKIPTVLTLSNSFMTYCRESGLYTLAEMEHEYLRLFSIDADTIPMAEGTVQRRNQNGMFYNRF